MVKVMCAHDDSGRLQRGTPRIIGMNKTWTGKNRLGKIEVMLVGKRIHRKEDRGRNSLKTWVGGREIWQEKDYACRRMGMHRFSCTEEYMCMRFLVKIDERIYIYIYIKIHVTSGLGRKRPP